MIRSGTGTLTVDGQDVEMVPDGCIIVDPGQVHTLTNTGDTELIFDYFGLQTETASHPEQ